MSFRDRWIAFRAWRLARKLSLLGLLLIGFLVLGLIVGYVTAIRGAVFWEDHASITIWQCLRLGIFNPRGFLITLLLFFMLCVVIFLFILHRKPRPVIESTDEHGTNYSSTGSLGAMNWMSAEEARREFLVGDVREMFGYIYGKLPDTKETVTRRDTKFGDGNKNVMILGQPGTGKSFSLIRNELIQALRRRESFVCTDPKGELFTDTSEYSKERCDETWTVNFIDPEYSCGWNVVGLVVDPKTGRLDDDRLEKWASTYMTNAMPDIPDRSDFWFMGAVNLLQAVIGLCAYEHEDFIRRTLLEVAQTIYDAIGLNERVSPVIMHDKKYSLVKAEKLFREVAKDVLTDTEIERTVKDIKDSAPPFSISQVYYEVLQLQSGTYTELQRRLSVLPLSHSAAACFRFFNNPNVKNEVKASTAQGLGHRMAPLRNEHLRRMLSHDEVDLLQINQKQCAVYLIVPDNSDRYKALTSLFFKFMFDELGALWDKTDQLCKEKGMDTLRVLRPVSVIMDEFANIGKIPEFDRFMSTGRSRKLNVTLAVQHILQLHDVYGDNAADTIKNDCDTVLFLGTNDDATAEWMSSFILGVTTIIRQSYSSSTGQLVMHLTEGVTESEQQRYLMYASELRKFSGEIICSQHGKNPLRLERFGYIEHPEARWFRSKSLKASFVPISQRFQEIDPLMILDLKETEAAIWSEEKARAEAENRPPVFHKMVVDKAAVQAENKARILKNVQKIALQKMSCFEQGSEINLDAYEDTDIVLNLEDYETIEEKISVVDGTFKEIESPKKPKKIKTSKKGTASKERPADVSELNDD